MGLEACVGTKKELEQGEIRGGSGGQLGPLQAPALHSLHRPVLHRATSRSKVNTRQRQQSILPWYSWDFTRTKASEHYSTVRSQGKGFLVPGNLVRWKTQAIPSLRKVSSVFSREELPGFPF